jgi:hypothetical protein
LLGEKLAGHEDVPLAVFGHVIRQRAQVPFLSQDGNFISIGRLTPVTTSSRPTSR